MIRFYVALSLVLAFAIMLSAQTSKSLDARRAQLRDAIQAEWEYNLRTNPEFATYVGDTRYNDRLGDYSPEAVAKEIEHTKQQLKLFESIDTTGFPDDEALNQQLMVRDLRQSHRERQVQRLADAGEPVRRSAPRLRINAVADAIHLGEGLRKLHRAAAPDSRRRSSRSRPT